MKTNEAHPRTSHLTVLAALAAGFLGMAPGGCPLLDMAQDEAGVSGELADTDWDAEEDKIENAQNERDLEIADLERELKTAQTRINEAENELAIVRSDLDRNKEQQREIKVRRGVRGFYTSQGEASLIDAPRAVRDEYQLSQVNARRSELKGEEDKLEDALAAAQRHEREVANQLSRLRRSPLNVSRSTAQGTARRSAATGAATRAPTTKAPPVRVPHGDR